MKITRAHNQPSMLQLLHYVSSHRSYWGQADQLVDWDIQ